MDTVPPGFRFYPTEEELVSFYLRNKLEASRDVLLRVMDRLIPVLDIYRFNPWELPQFSGDYLCHGHPDEWFFFIPRQESEAHGGRSNRLTTTGYWKATGSPGFIYSSNSNRSIGEKRTMVFYEGRAPNGRKTDWKMNQYKAIDEEASSSSGAHPMLKQEFSLCRVYKKSKFVRAFDRRPLGVETGEKMRAQAAHGADEATTSHQNPSTVQITCSHDSSSLEDHGQPFQTGESSNVAIMDVDTEPIWDWAQLDWELK